MFTTSLRFIYRIKYNYTEKPKALNAIKFYAKHYMVIYQTFFEKKKK